jgi:hypothetical protein
MNFQDNRDAIDVSVAELLVATADSADEMIDPAVQEVLQLLRDKMNIDTAFVRVWQPEPQGRAAEATCHSPHPLEASWGQQVLGERMLQDGGVGGTFLDAPVVLADGSIYGTLCGSSRDRWSVQRDFKILKSTAQLIAHKLDQSRMRARRRPLFDREAGASLQPQTQAA